MIIASISVVMYLVYDPWYLNYDARYAILWAHDLWHGFTPEYNADFAPTPHPLQMAVGSIALLFGDDADRVMVWMVLLCFGALVWLAFRLGAQLFGTWAGVITAVVVVSRPAIERDAILAYQDLPFEALIVGAVLLEAQKPKRGYPALIVLAVAGLLRPEAWVLSVLYVVWLWWGSDASWGQVARWLGLALIAPALWIVQDLAVTGSPVHSLTGTADLAVSNERRRSLSDVPYSGTAYLFNTLREPLVLGVPIGIAFAWMFRPRQGLLVLAVAVAMLAVFAAGPIFGLPLISRYVRTPAILLATFYGAAIFGWRLLPVENVWRKRWLWIGVFSAALSLAFIPKQIGLLRGLHRTTARDSHLYSDLREAAEAPVVQRAFAACQPLSTSDHRPIPYLRWWIDGPPGSVGTVRLGASPLGQLFLHPRRTFYAKRFYRDNFPSGRAPTRFQTIYMNRSYRISASPACVATLNLQQNARGGGSGSSTPS